jgi:hypothetical protein
MAYEFNILSLLRVGMVLGWSYYDNDGDENYHEFNLYLICVQLRFRWADVEYNI